MRTRDVETSGLVFEYDCTVQRKPVRSEFAGWVYYSLKLGERFIKYKGKMECTDLKVIHVT